MKYFLDNIKNTIDFFLRQKFRFSRRNYYVAPESKDGLFEDIESSQKERYLFEKYNLSSLKENSTRMNYLENLYTLEILDKYLCIEKKHKISALDIGAKNWFYAQGEYFFFKHFCDELSLGGIELDAHRLYTSLFSRFEVAKFYSKGLDGACYIAGDLLEHNEKYDFIVWFLPFVIEYPLIKWGLPLRYFKPQKMLEHACSLLNEGGQMLIINQDIEEYEVQQKLYESIGADFRLLGKVDSTFLEYKYDRYASIFQR